MVKKKFKITGMHCTSCAMTIDMDLEDLDGIKSSHTSYAKQETEVEFDFDKMDDQKIIETIKKSGYKALVDSIYV
ncbi:heavy-metal-associated domain-containing protein [Candidatus Daviesbacteria bacterium]|nr:heavy-metal-associated domain-containing protein [Candidatus Daviesbacteria bacterium]